MSEVTNEQLLNAIKHLTKKVEELENLLQTSTPKTHKETSEKMELSEKVIEAILSSKGVKDAAEKLGWADSVLTQTLKNSNIPHMYGETWKVAIRRVIDGSPMLDNFTYPDEWFEPATKIKIKKAWTEKGPSYCKEKLGKPMNVVGRFVQLYCEDV